MAILFIVALVLAWPTFGISVVAYIALFTARSYLRTKKKMDGTFRRAEFQSAMEPLFHGQFADFFLALDVPTIIGEGFNRDEARECMRHIMYYLADNPSEAALFMRGLEKHRTKTREAVLDPISAALYERNRNLKGEMHLVAYRAIATIRAKNPSLSFFIKADVAEIATGIKQVEFELEIDDIIRNAEPQNARATVSMLPNKSLERTRDR